MSRNISFLILVVSLSCTALFAQQMDKKCTPAHMSPPTAPDTHTCGTHPVCANEGCSGEGWTDAIPGRCVDQYGSQCYENYGVTNVRIYFSEWKCESLANNCKCLLHWTEPLDFDDKEVQNCQ